VLLEDARVNLEGFVFADDFDRRLIRPGKATISAWRKIGPGNRCIREEPSCAIISEEHRRWLGV
jgi:hypothetical protein